MRYLAHTQKSRKDLLKAIGVSSVDDLFEDVPRSARLTSLLDLPLHQSEWAVEGAFRTLAANTQQAGDRPCFLGAGAYYHHVPAAVDHLIQRGEFLTSYTPYQPEISQGTLQYLFEFQTQVTLLTGMEVANASMYDGATATVEAVMMANRVTGRKKALLSDGLHPHYQDVIHTYARFCGFSTDVLTEGKDFTDDISCVVVQYPDFYGNVEDFRTLSTACHAKGILLIVVVTEIVALGLLMPPGEIGADIVAGEGQSLGCGLNFGGPTVGLFATLEKYVRQMPGRVVGQTVDKEGTRGWVLTLSTREQHIRREKATSNICTNSGLCALAFTIHLSLLGELGLQRLAKLNHQKAISLANALSKISGIKVLNKTFFNEFTVRLPVDAQGVVEHLASLGILGGIPVSRLLPGQRPNDLLVAVTETVTDAHLQQFVKALEAACASKRV
ncbi:MAG: aminomethyl-transferring glycine dehydrogenase subunit GcvPA [Alphaproteobacteria bacterium]|jgi:glycine dehydrogenase subunit 1|nr:aminomethyl-transferring glycine dehydrogenase subunit GcvPA [Alphaproteobacteria bacterium]